MNTMKTTTRNPSSGACRRRRHTAIAAATTGLVITAACGTSSTSSSSDTTPATALAPSAPQDIAGTFDIGGRRMYIQCTGQGSPTVVLVSGGGIAADLWDSPLGEQPTVYPTIAKTNRVCAYDRPGTTRALAEVDSAGAIPSLSRSPPRSRRPTCTPCWRRPVRPGRSCSPRIPTVGSSLDTSPTATRPRWPAWCSSTASLRSSGDAMPRICGPRGSSGTPRRRRSSRTTPTTNRSTSTSPRRSGRPRAIQPMPLIVLTADKPYPGDPTTGASRRHQHGDPRGPGRVPTRGGPCWCPAPSTSPRPTVATTSCSRTRCSSPTPSSRWSLRSTKAAPSIELDAAPSVAGPGARRGVRPVRCRWGDGRCLDSWARRVGGDTWCCRSGHERADEPGHAGADRQRDEDPHGAGRTATGRRRTARSRRHDRPLVSDLSGGRRDHHSDVDEPLERDR